MSNMRKEEREILQKICDKRGARSCYQPYLTQGGRSAPIVFNQGKKPLFQTAISRELSD